jgi:IMP dehydrogenase/GMP reductase
MERINHNVHLAFNDILLVPFDDSICTIMSRNDPDISSEITNGKKLNIPIISAPMDTITGIEMMKAMDVMGGMGIHTRFINDQYEQMKLIQAAKEAVKTIKGPKAFAIGVKNSYDMAYSLCDLGIDIICIDIANGNHQLMINAIQEVSKLKDKFKTLSIIAGNIATPKAGVRLAEAGADAIKIGVGPGAVCSTRRVTGFGIPQLTAIMRCSPPLRERGIKVISDGGIRFSGDAVKALWAGADTVMMGYVFAGHKECPLVSDERLNKDLPQGVNIPKRIYRGMSSRLVSKRSDIAAEGVCFEVVQKGSVLETVKEYAASIRAACTMGNAINLKQLRNNVTAIRVSTMSQSESDPLSGE